VQERDRKKGAVALRNKKAAVEELFAAAFKK
jgi:hypothetical protein